MKTGDGVARDARVWSSRGADVDFETVWPRQFDLDTLKTLLGEDADHVLAEVLAHRVNAPLWHLVDRGGRRWRPTVTRLAYLVSGGPDPVPEPLCQVAELLHTGSLIIDDIQDDGMERRGGPSAHLLFGVPTALNAANASYFRALETLRGILPSTLRLRALDMLSEELFAAHLGQALDLALGAQVRSLRLGTAQYGIVARAKTGALVRIAARLGAIAADADAAREAALGEWASEIGLGYQIQNDLGDLANGMQDVATSRPTYPLLLVLEDGGVAAATLRAYLGRQPLVDEDLRTLRALFARERVVERSRAAAADATVRALEAIRFVPRGAARTALEETTRKLAAPAKPA